MKAVRLYAPEGVRLEEVPEPRRGSDGARLWIRSGSTFGAGVRTVHHGHQNLSPPRIIGDTEEP